MRARSVARRRVAERSDRRGGLAPSRAGRLDDEEAEQRERASPGPPATKNAAASRARVLDRAADEVAERRADGVAA